MRHPVVVRRRRSCGRGRFAWLEQAERGLLMVGADRRKWREHLFGVDAAMKSARRASVLLEMLSKPELKI